MRWVFAAVLLIACGPSAEERHEAERAARDEAMRAGRMQVLREMEISTVRDAAARCAESPDGMMRLLLAHQEFVVPMDSTPFVKLEFVARVRNAAARHDSTKSCARLVDSVARVMSRADTHAGPQ